MKRTTRILLSAAAILGLASTAGSADAQLTPKPILTIIPTFSCSVSLSGTSGTAHVTKTNAATLDKTKDVIAVVQTPSGKITVATCGKSFASDAVGTAVNIGVTVPATKDKTWIYTCTASQATTSLACNPIK